MEKMRLSRYIIWVKSTSNFTIAACTLTRAIIQLNPIAKADLEQGDPRELKDLTPKQFKECVEMGFLVPDNLKEQDYLSSIMHRDRLYPEALTTYVALSSACNFDCVYCFEHGQINSEIMSRAQVKQLLAWYKRKLKQGKFKICSVDLFGGEPILVLKIALGFLAELKEITDLIGVQLKVRLITNGYFLTKRVIEKLYQFGLYEIHVTLDGSKSSHDQRRFLKKSKKGTFDVIFNNLLEVAKIELPFDIMCRISFDRSNIQGIPALLDLIKKKDATGRIDPYFGCITQTTLQTKSSESFCSQYVLKDEEIAKGYIYLYTESYKRGFSIPDFFSFGPCMAIAEGGTIIAPNGDIFKCLDMIGIDNLVVGNIVESHERPLYSDFMQASQLQQCLKTDCPFVPVCGGGCIMESYLRTKDFTHLICHRDILERIYAALLPLKYLHEN
jgi:uncharacterized protein